MSEHVIVGAGAVVQPRRYCWPTGASTSALSADAAAAPSTRRSSWSPRMRPMRSG